MTNQKAKYAERHYEYYCVEPGESIRVVRSGHVGEEKLCD